VANFASFSSVFFSLGEFYQVAMSLAAESSSFATGLLGASSAVEGMFHELSALSIFTVSFILWHYVKNHKHQHLSPEVMKTQMKVVAKEIGSSRPSCKQKSESAKLYPQSNINVKEVEKQMFDLLQHKEFTRALHLFRSLERTGRDVELKNEELFCNFIVSAIRVEKFDVVERMLRIAKQNLVQLSVKSWKTMLKMLSTKKQFSICLSAYNIFEEIPEDQVVFSCLINAALDSNLPLEAAKMLQRYRCTDLHPKEWILFFRTYVLLGDVDNAEATFDSISAKEMTPLMLNLLLLTCVNAKQMDRAERCLQKAHALEKDGNATIVNVVSYNTVIKGYAQTGQLDRCFVLLQVLSEHGLEPDETTFGMVVDVCIQDDCVGVADRLMASLRQSGTQASTVMCTHFLKLLIKTDRLKDASDLYEDMKKSDRSRPDVVTCSMLIKAYINANDLTRALCVFDDMTALGCKPDDIILTRLLDGCRQMGESARGIDLFDRFVKIGVMPSDYSILTLLKLLGSAGNHSAAHRIVANCQQCYGTKPSVIHYTCLMSGALKSKDYNQAWQAYLLMCQHGVQPDATSITTLLPGLVAAQHWERAVEVVSSALKDVSPPLKVPAEMLNNALSQMIAAQSPRQHVTRLQLLLQGAGVPITARNAKRVD